MLVLSCALCGVDWFLGGLIGQGAALVQGLGYLFGLIDEPIKPIIWLI